VAEQERLGSAPFLADTPKRWRWFRPPMGAMSPAMASVLRSHGYSTALGDVFSNDVLVGGSHPAPATQHGNNTREGTGEGEGSGGGSGSGSAAFPPRTVAYHVSLSASQARAGSVAVFHCPRACDRLGAVPIVGGFVSAMHEPTAGPSSSSSSSSPSSGGLRCVTLSELATTCSEAAPWPFTTTALQEGVAPDTETPRDAKARERAGRRRGE
jgi:hypothetical protein